MPLNGTGLESIPEPGSSSTTRVHTTAPVASSSAASSEASGVVMPM